MQFLNQVGVVSGTRCRSTPVGPKEVESAGCERLWILEMAMVAELSVNPPPQLCSVSDADVC